MPLRALDDPKLLPFLPLLYVAWEDGDLSPSELDELRSSMAEFGDDSRAALAVFLDPAQAPTANDLHELRRAIRARTANVALATRPSLASLGAAMGGTDVEPVRRLEGTLGLVGAEPVQSLVAHAPRSVVEGLARERAPASFDVAALTKVLDGRYAKVRDEVRSLLRDPQFVRETGLSRKEQRTRVRAWLRFLASKGLGHHAYPEHPTALGEFIAVFETVATFDLALVVKLGVQFGLFGGSIYFLGGEAQKRELLPRVATLELPGCFAMSELGHGSNVRDLETLARYDQATRSFEIHTPTETARKEWIGGAAEDARLATVFAQLEVDGEGRGVHAFLVPIRDDAGAVLPGVRIEDCGDKMGLDGVDNGRLWFEQVRVPREAMLHRYASIDDEGRYQSAIASDAKRFFTMLGTLVGGRISVAGAGLTAAKTALTIAVRYGDTRRQFGPPDAPETLLLDYPTHQRRLMPLVAEAYALHFAQAKLVARYEGRSEEDEREVEALAAGIKAVATWFTTHAIQTARECCGGQGYLAINELARLKADTDVFTTFEGDNTVLMQLVAKSLLTDFRAQFGDAKVVSLVRHLARRALTAITEQNPIATRLASADHLRSADFQRAALRFRETSLVTSVANRLRKRIGEGMEATAAFVSVQSHLVSLARAHVERVVFDSANEAVQALDAPLRAPVSKLLDLYALARIEDDLAWFLENGYVEPGKARAIRKEVDALSAEVRVDAVALVDAFASDVRAPIGASWSASP